MNAAVTAWVLLGPALLVVYEAAFAGVPWRAVRCSRCARPALTLAASLWWIAPILVQARYGIDFLEFTEQPGTIWDTTSMSETLRLMGYWVSYIGVGFHGAAAPVLLRRGRAAVLARWWWPPRCSCPRSRSAASPARGASATGRSSSPSCSPGRS